MERRLYGLGDLLEDLHDHSLGLWKKDVGRDGTWRAAREKKLERVEVRFSYTLKGVAWIYVDVVGKRSAWSRDYAYKAWVRPGGAYELDARCTD